MTDKFGWLESVDLREAWPDEARDFTPWLAENLDRLTPVIGVELELVQTEAPVHQYSVDILARNPLDDSYVVIENQLDGSNSGHLGQVITYIAGRDARTAIWIASDFTNAHLEAVRRLNDETSNSFNIFAIQVKVVRIGNSPLIPEFKVLECPSEWDRQIRESSQGTGISEETRKFQREFWTYYSKRHPTDGIPQGRERMNVSHRLEDVGLRIDQSMDQKGVWISMQKLRDSSLPQSTPDLVAPLLPILAEELKIDQGELAPRSARRILQIDTTNRDNWSDAVDWLHDCLTAYRHVLENTPA